MLLFGLTISHTSLSSHIFGKAIKSFQNESQKESCNLLYTYCASVGVIHNSSNRDGISFFGLKEIFLLTDNLELFFKM
jgi:hypothetical protein